jgi:hypothetical protein
MSLSSHIINNMHIKTLLNYLKKANSSITLVLKNPLSHSIRIRPVIKSHTNIAVENIMRLRDELETLYDEYVLNAQTIIQEDIAERERDLKEKLIDLLDNDFENKFVKKLRLDLNDFIDPYFLVAYAQIKLNELGNKRPELLLHALMAKRLAIKAEETRNSLDSIDPTTTSWIVDLDEDVVYPDEQENKVKQYIAQASAIFHGLDEYEYMHNLSKNKAGKIIKRRIRRTKRRNINNRNSRKYRKYRNSTRRTH